MFCIKCGAKNSDEAVYCQKCGTMLEAEEETRIAKRPIEEINEEHDEERHVFSISPTLMFVKIGYGLAVLGAFLLVALFIFIGQLTGFYVPSWLSVLLGLSLLLIPAFYHLKQKMVRYTLTDSKIEIDEGFIFQNSRNIPLRSIQDVSVSSTITQRMLGFGNLVIDNASEDGGKIVLKNINTPKKYADVLLKQMRQLNK
ncbi:MAG TPA: PH domain-containing protein [Pyrinomonadaceae bacterium]|nr:PH domain-containing protein [Pyrinomonadaceae bacterium]